MYYRYVNIINPSIHTKWYRISHHRFLKNQQHFKSEAHLLGERIETKPEPTSKAQSTQRKHWRQLGDLARLQQSLTMLKREHHEHIPPNIAVNITLLVNYIQILQAKIRGGP